MHRDAHGGLDQGSAAIDRELGLGLVQNDEHLLGRKVKVNPDSAPRRDAATVDESEAGDSAPAQHRPERHRPRALVDRIRSVVAAGIRLDNALLQCLLLSGPSTRRASAPCSSARSLRLERCGSNQAERHRRPNNESPHLPFSFSIGKR